MKKINIAAFHARPYAENAFAHGWQVTVLDGFNDYDLSKFSIPLPPSLWHNWLNGSPASKGNSLNLVTSPQPSHLTRHARPNCALMNLVRKLVFGQSPRRGGSKDLCIDPLPPEGMLHTWHTLPKGLLMFGSPIEHFPEVLEEAKPGRTLLNASATAVRLCRSPATLQRLATDGLQTPSTLYDGKGRWLIKNGFRSSGKSVREYDGDLREGEYPQRYISGRPIGALYISSPEGNTALLGVARHITGNADFGQPPFMFGGLVWQMTVSKTVTDILNLFGLRAAKQTSVAGFWGADFILEANGSLWLTEINPRPTAGCELWAKSVNADIVQTQINALAGSLPQPAAPNDMVYGTAVCYAKEDMVFNGTEKWLAKGARDIPNNDTSIKAGQPVLSLYAEADTEIDVLASLKKTASTLYDKSPK